MSSTGINNARKEFPQSSFLLALKDKLHSIPITISHLCQKCMTYLNGAHFVGFKISVYVPRKDLCRYKLVIPFYLVKLLFLRYLSFKTNNKTKRQIKKAGGKRSYGTSGHAIFRLTAFWLQFK